MKLKTLYLACLLLLTPCLSWGVQELPSADSLVIQGRAFLEQKDLANANAKFAAALVSDPNHANANFFYAVTRLLSQANTAAGTTFLNRLGFGANGRDIYAWTASIAKDGNGKAIVPVGVNANEFTAQLHSQILPEIIGAEANLAKLDSGFQVNLTAAETTTSAVTVDYADVLFLRAMLHGFEYWIYTVNSWNAEAQLTALKSLSDAGNLNAERVLKDYPQLFTFATTGDLLNAQTAFDAFASRYAEASMALRERTDAEGFLFVYDSEMASQEEDFANVVKDLKLSLSEPTTLCGRPGITLDMTKHFSVDGAPRAYLPRMKGNSFVLGSLPDSTFGGLVLGLSPDNAERVLSDIIIGLPTLSSIAFDGLDQNDNQIMRLKLRTKNPFFSVLASDDVTFSSGVSYLSSFSYMAEVSEGVFEEFQGVTLEGQPSRQFFKLQASSEIIIEGIILDGVGAPLQNAYVYFEDEEPEFSERGSSNYGYTYGDGHFFMVSKRGAHFPNTLNRLRIEHENGTFVTGRIFGAAQLNKIIRVPFIAVPPNDDFDNAIELVGFPVETMSNNQAATREEGEDYHGGSSEQGGIHSVWWKWTATTTGTISVTTHGSNFDTLLGFYEIGDGELFALDQNDDDHLSIGSGESGGGDFNSLNSRVDVDVVEGVTYYIAVDGYSEDSGNIVLNITEQLPVKIGSGGD